MLTLWLAWLSEVNSQSNHNFAILCGFNNVTSLKKFYTLLMLWLYSCAQTMKMILWVAYPMLSKAHLFQVCVSHLPIFFILIFSFPNIVISVLVNWRPLIWVAFLFAMLMQWYGALYLTRLFKLLGRIWLLSRVNFKVIRQKSGKLLPC